MQFLTVVIAADCIDLTLELLDATLDVLGLSAAFDDRAVVFIDGDLLRATKFCDGHVLELNAEFFHDGLATGEHRDVFEHRLATIAESWSLHSANLQHAAQLVHDKHCKRFAVDVFGDDQK